MFDAVRVFVAGATGVIGTRVVRLLTDREHLVMGMTRSPAKLPLLKELGAEAVLCDVYDSYRLRRQVFLFRPEVIIDLLTDLPDSAADVPAFTRANNRIRVVGTRNVISAAVAAGSPRLIAESVAWQLPGAGGEAVRDMEEAILNYGGAVFRYGQLYGPGTFHVNEKPAHPRIFVDKAAEITVEHLHTTARVLDIVEAEAD